MLLYSSTRRLNLNCVYTPFAQSGKQSLIAVESGANHHQACKQTNQSFILPQYVSSDAVYIY